jgi:hypothetical protein
VLVEDASRGGAGSAIVRRKEMERRAGRGQFFGAWGTLLLIRPATEAAPLRLEARAAAELAQAIKAQAEASGRSHAIQDKLGALEAKRQRWRATRSKACRVR